VVLLDISMPVMTGFEAARALKKIMPSLPILFVSSYADPAYIAEAHAIGGHGCIRKGSATTELPRAVAEAVADAS